MTTVPPYQPSSSEHPKKKKTGWGKFPSLRHLLIPIVVLICGALLAGVLFQTGPKAKRKPLVRLARLVQIQEVHFSNQPVLIQAMGNVQPARKIDLQPRVSGEVIQVNDQLVPGGLFLKGQTILQIDPTDYALVVRQRTSETAQAKSQLRLELGQQSIAQREYELLGEKIRDEDRDLVLRKPQLESAKAMIETHQAALDKALLDLERTTVKSPFNAIIQTREVDIGALVTNSTNIATLVGTDQYWIEVPVPVDTLQWIRVPNSTSKKGSSVQIYNDAAWGKGKYKAGFVDRLASDLEDQGRMARLFISVPDPLGLKTKLSPTPLLLRSYVRVEIEGKELESVAAIDRNLLRDGDKVWIMDNENKLEIRSVEISFRGREQVMVTGGLREGERLITTHLSAPVQGMPLRTSPPTAP